MHGKEEGEDGVGPVAFEKRRLVEKWLLVLLLASSQVKGMTVYRYTQITFIA